MTTQKTKPGLQALIAGREAAGAARRARKSIQRAEAALAVADRAHETAKALCGFAVEASKAAGLAGDEYAAMVKGCRQ